MPGDTNVISEVGRKYLRLHRAANVGPIRLKALRDQFGSVDAILSASIAELERVEGIGPISARSIFQCRGDDDVEVEIERAARIGVRILCLEDPDYPKSLLHITDPPTCLYVCGTIEPADAVAVSIVGTRRCSHYGREQALRFGEALAAAGFTVVSGLVRGIDGYAHRGALRGRGRTIAVLGNGLSTIYPEEHAELADQIAQAGAVISELPIDAGPEAKNFPGRNRIIIGLSLGVLVIEAGKRSGALITARLASEYNREIFALPGRIDHSEQNAGSNALIRDGGAKLVTCLEDILDELGDVGAIMRPELELPQKRKGECLFDASGVGPSPPPSPLKGEGKSAPTRLELNSTHPGSTATHSEATAAQLELSANETAVHRVIAEGVEDVDSICVRSGIAHAGIGSVLTRLQIRGMIKQLPGDRYILRAAE
ncbi:MAG: DNA-protecting protein DprA [Planctomycetes bacterium]|nr:DNA-protecting protein DprA [Planctomycetota bacterium]